MATILKEWSTEEVRAVTRFLWAQNAKSINIHRQIAAVYGANMMSVELMRKWLGASVMDEDRIDHQHQIRPTIPPYLAALGFPSLWKTEDKNNFRGRRFPSDDAVKAKIRKRLRQRLRLRPGF